LDNPVDPQFSRRNIRDRSVALLLVGIVMLLPPIAGISLIDEKFLGVPVPLLYVFAVWALLIAGAALLARPLRNSEETPPATDPTDPTF